MAMTTDPVTWFQQLADARKGTTKSTIPQELADTWTEVMIEAVRAFHEPDFMILPAVDYIDNLSDEDVKKRIRGYQRGYNMEYMRRVEMTMYGLKQNDFDNDTLGYEFAQLPWPLQRSVVSHWDRLHMEYLRAHKGLFYWPDIGYVWLFEDVKVPYRDSDEGERPEPDALTDKYGEYGGHPII